jgi:RsiW-degrading membrane proteinase PrsW (M82 family)
VSLAPVLVGLAPVAAFLAALVFLDSYKLVRLRSVVLVMVAGVAAAGVAYALSGAILDTVSLDEHTYSRYGAPLLEEFLKALIVVALVRMHRIGFLVDAAIFGFAAGAGFAMVENLFYLHLVPGAAMGVWIVRGFGTALMHGGATAIFAVIGIAMLGRANRMRSTIVNFAPGFVLAAALHSAYNHLIDHPLAAAAGIAVVLPLLLHGVFEHSERAVGRWLGKGFDADAEMLELLHSGRLSDSPVGRYLHTLKSKFHGPVVADILCYVRLYTELALRAKGLLIMRENGFEAQVDDATRAKFDEMRYLERSIGPTGLRAIVPILHMSHKELWQMYMLGK